MTTVVPIERDTLPLTKKGEHRLSYAALLEYAGRAVRVFYDVTTGLLDPTGDAELKRLHLEDPFAVTDDAQLLESYVALVSRPYVLCKREATAPRQADDVPLFYALAPGETVRLLFARPPRTKDDADQPVVPFDLTSTAGGADAPIVLFDDTTLVPLLTCRVANVEALRSGAASGILSVVKDEAGANEIF